MLQVAVCDEEEPVSHEVQKIVEETLDCEVSTYHTGEELLSSGREYDILLMDIGIGEPNGMETARRIRKDSDVLIIFITAWKEHVFEAFDVDAYHYLLKPIDEDKLREVLKRAGKECLDRKTAEPLVIRRGGITHSIRKEEILYAENSGRKIILHISDRQMEYYARMKELESELGDVFFRIHRGYLVNLRAVNSYHANGVVLKNGEEILMAKSKYQEFVTAYMNFLRRSR